MLQFILGRCGCGKTEYLRERFCDLARAGEDGLVMLVPDQITFETETDFLRRLGERLCGNIRVLGFSRLSDYVFENTGHRFLSFADDGVRHVVMSLALEQVSDQLELFAKRASAFDLCDLMLTAVNEYKKCAITADMLRDAAESCADDTLSKKLSETAIVYDAYKAVMSSSYMDPLDSLTRVAEILDATPLFEGCTVAVDAFYGFTSQEYEVLARLMRQSREMLVALCDDTGAAADSDVFFVPHRTARRLSRIAHENGVETAPSVHLDTLLRYRYPELSALERNLYRYDRTTYDDPAEHITLYRGRDIYDECDFVARTIRKLIEGGMRYREIAVIARSTDRYAGVLDTYLEKYGISYFMNRPENIDAYPLVRLVTAAFDIVDKGFDRDDVLTLLKTGLTNYTVEDIAAFENYLFVWDISGKELYNKFTDHPRGFADEFSDEDTALLSLLESMRADVIGRLQRFRRHTRDTDGAGIAAALMRLLYGLSCDKNIERLCDVFEQEVREDLSHDLVRIWNVLCEVLDKMVAVIGSYRLSSRRFSELLYAYFSNTEISSIPRGIDEVDVGTADRALLSGKRAVFVIGVLDGEFPHTPVEAGVFTDNERNSLRELNLPVSDSIEELVSTEKYYAYTALTSASEEVFVSYYACDLSGNPTVPSSIVGELCVIFPSINHIEYDVLTVFEHLYSRAAAFDYLVDHYRRSSPAIEALRGYFADSADYGGVVSAIEHSIHRDPRRIDDATLMRRLFGDRMTLSSSQIDRFYLCRFSYFCRYGLSVKERKPASMDALEYGTLMHYVLEDFFSRHQGDDFSMIDSDRIAREVSDALDGYAERHLGGIASKSDRFRYLFYRIKSTAVGLVEHIVTELAQSDFEPVDFELSIGDDIPAYTVALPDGHEVVIRGAVDRVDLMEKDGVDYIRIIDYKTGKKKFNLSDILYGINLQMLLYLSAIDAGGAQRYGDRITPAGVLYMPAVSPSVNADSAQSAQDIALLRERQYTMHGIVLDDPEVLAGMERELRGLYIPVTVKGDRITAGADNLASLEQLGAIFRRIDTLIAGMAEALYDGEIGAVPLKGGYDACDWCPYMAVCTRREDDPERRIEKQSADEVYDELMREEADDRG